jgi:hypothetical protein
LKNGSDATTIKLGRELELFKFTADNLFPSVYPKMGLRYAHALGRCVSQAARACPDRSARRILTRMGTKSRDRLYGSSVRVAAERAAEARCDSNLYVRRTK